MSDFRTFLTPLIVKPLSFNKNFINSFGIKQNSITTQIEPHDWIAEVTQTLTRVNNICIDLSQDMWIYIANDIFALNVIDN